jgi:hypothetical protein
MLAQSRADHRGPTHGYYLDVPFAETLARHATEPMLLLSSLPAGVDGEVGRDGRRGSRPGIGAALSRPRVGRGCRARAAPARRSTSSWCPTLWRTPSPSRDGRARPERAGRRTCFWPSGWDRWYGRGVLGPPSSSYLPSSRLRGAATGPVTAPTTAWAQRAAGSAAARRRVDPPPTRSAHRLCELPREFWHADEGRTETAGDGFPPDELLGTPGRPVHRGMGLRGHAVGDRAARRRAPGGPAIGALPGVRQGADLHRVQRHGYRTTAGALAGVGLGRSWHRL